MLTKYYKNIDNMQDLLKSDIKIFLPIFSRKLILESIEEEHKNLANNLIAVPRSTTMFGLTNSWLDNYM